MVSTAVPGTISAGGSNPSMAAGTRLVSNEGAKVNRVEVVLSSAPLILCREGPSESKCQPLQLNLHRLMIRVYRV